MSLLGPEYAMNGLQGVPQTSAQTGAYVDLLLKYHDNPNIKTVQCYDIEETVANPEPTNVLEDKPKVPAMKLQGAIMQTGLGEDDDDDNTTSKDNGPKDDKDKEDGEKDQDKKVETIQNANLESDKGDDKLSSKPSTSFDKIDEAANDTNRDETKEKNDKPANDDGEDSTDLSDYDYESDLSELDEDTAKKIDEIFEFPIKISKGVVGSTVTNPYNKKGKGLSKRPRKESSPDNAEKSPQKKKLQTFHFSIE